MQKFYHLNMQDYVNVAVPKMQKSIESAASNFSGNAFPTTNLQVGMFCMRTDDNNNIYKLISVNPATWVLVDNSAKRISDHNTDANAHSNFKGATSTANGVRGMVPAPTTAQVGYFLCADGSWKQISLMKGATASVAGSGGLVPAPAKGLQDATLLGNGTWGMPKTDLSHITDMTAFIRSLGNAADAAAARTQLGVKELTPSNLFDALHTYGDNYVPADTSNTGWNSLGVCSIFYTENMINNQPTQYGQLINIPANKNQESTQLWIDQGEGRIYSRKGNASIIVNDQPFRESSGSGIIAQSLAQNGWVKFSNGLIIQWVHNINNNVNVVFPIAFNSQVFYFNGIDTNWQDKNITYNPSSLTLTGVTFSIEYLGDTRYFFIGV